MVRLLQASREGAHLYGEGVARPASPLDRRTFWVPAMRQAHVPYED